MKKLLLVSSMTMLCAVMAWGENVEIAQIGETTYYQGDAEDIENHIYATAQAALDATIADVADEGTIKLLSSVESIFTLGSGLNKTITLDVNGKTLSNTTATATVTIEGGSKLILVNTASPNAGCITSSKWTILCKTNAELEINDGVTVQSSGSNNTIYGYANSTMTINGGTVKYIGTATPDLINCVGCRLTINGGTIENTTKWDAIYAKNGAQITINGGLVTNTCTGAAGYVIDLYGNTSGSGDPIATTLTINGGSIVSNTAQKGYGVSIWGNGATLNMTDGAITTTSFAITGNGTAKYGGTTINISGGTISSSTADAAIYHPQAGTLNITGGTITGKTGIGIKGGTLTISGGTIHAVGNNGGRVEGYNNGINPSFAAVQIESNPGYAGDMSITVSDEATLISDSWYAFYEYLTNQAGSTEVSSIAVTGGHFKGGILVSQDLAAQGGFVRGGDWSVDVLAHVEEGYTVSDSGDENYPYRVITAPAGVEKETGTTTVLVSDEATSSEKSEAESATGKTAVETSADKQVIVAHNTDVAAAGDNDVVEVKKVTIEKDKVLTIKEGATLKVGSGSVHIAEDATGAAVVVEKGATLVVDGLIYGATENNIVLETAEGEQGALLFSPQTEFVREDHPYATVKMRTNGHQTGNGANDYVFDRFAIPTIDGNATSFSIEGGTSSVVLYPGQASFSFGVWEWNDAAGSWDALATLKNTQPMKGYQLTTNAKDPGVVFVFKGQVCGNADKDFEFDHTGFFFYGNSYTADIDIKKFLNDFDADMQKTVWVFDPYDNGAVKTVTKSLYGKVKYANGEYIKDIHSMQAFILNRLSGTGAVTVDYSSAVWGNPKYGITALSPAPAKREVAEENMDFITLRVKSAEETDEVVLVRSNSCTSAFDNGEDATKFTFGDNTMAVYANLDGEKLGVLASDDISSTLLSFRAGNATDYTLSFADIEGDAYAVRDILTGAVVNIAEGATYSFTQEAGTTVPARFEVLRAANAPTAVDALGAGSEQVIRKVIKNNTLFIVRDSEWFTVDGQRVR